MARENNLLIIQEAPTIGDCRLGAFSLRADHVFKPLEHDGHVICTIYDRYARRLSRKLMQRLRSKQAYRTPSRPRLSCIIIPTRVVLIKRCVFPTQHRLKQCVCGELFLFKQEAAGVDIQAGCLPEYAPRRFYFSAIHRIYMKKALRLKRPQSLSSYQTESPKSRLNCSASLYGQSFTAVSLSKKFLCCSLSNFIPPMMSRCSYSHATLSAI